MRVALRLLPVTAIASACLAVSAAVAQQASTLPASQPTALPAAPPALQAEPARTVEPPHVQWSNGLLRIQSNGTPLNEVLRLVSRSTGMHVVGSAGAEPLYGSYGPGTLSEVVAQLLDGLPLNFMLVQQSSGTTLSFSPRGGAVPVATANAAAGSAGEEPYAQTAPSAAANQGVLGIRPAPRQPRAQPASINEVSPPNPNENSGANEPVGNGEEKSRQLPASPNGVSSPDEIMRKIQELRQQGAQVAPTRPAPQPDDEDQ